MVLEFRLTGGLMFDFLIHSSTSEKDFPLKPSDLTKPKQNSMKCKQTGTKFYEVQTFNRNPVEFQSAN